MKDNRVISVKPGYQTSEFWLNVIALFMSGGLGMEPSMVDSGMAFMPVLITGIYTLGRSIVKAFSKQVR